MKFKRGEYQKFTATRMFKLGEQRPGDPIVRIEEGDEIEFDGTSVKLSSGEEILIPQMRSSIQIGWLVPSEDFQEGSHPISAESMSANIKVRAAQISSAMDDQRTPMRMEASEVNRVVSTPEFNGRAIQPKNITRTASGVAQEGVAQVIKTLSTSSQKSFRLDGKTDPSAEVAAPIVVAEAPVSRSVRRPKKSDEMISITDTSNPVSTTTKGSNPETVVSLESAMKRRKMAKQMCPDFPDSYDFAAPERKRLARLTADFEERADVLMAVYAAETDSMKAAIESAFPTVFG